MEAALLFPLILLSIVCLLFFGVFSYQNVYVRQAAEVAAERAAFVWDNSHKDPRSGHYGLGQHDGLYWRIKEGASFLFDWLTGRENAKVDVREASTKGGSGPSGKLIQAATQVPEGLRGSLSYRQSLFTKEVQVELQKPLKSPVFLSAWLTLEEAEGKAVNRMVDPVEFIRTIDTTRNYIPDIKNKVSKSEARYLLKEPADVDIPDTKTITSANDAATYVRTLVSGKERKDFKTPSGQIRYIDALDANGIAHQAFYTTNKTNLPEQMKKDVELLQTGQIKGVVWHIFKKDTAGLTPALRQELENNGIVLRFYD
ncbi:hypothetical protein PYL81_17855 [Paenibacillus larvae subsp. larvae]|uniref:hypothetical protein n=1 Tax=Paenibacillus larvae TaxID=1464 RepID=UPI0023A9E91A|nr:hypothetical protein [Paenibacillus larvae]MDE5162495.1 hypothetical protein [Paenibacillus larvae subsp. larvae]